MSKIVVEKGAVRIVKRSRRAKLSIELIGFDPAEETMIRNTLQALESAGYDISLFLILIREEMPAGFRGMSWPDGAVLGAEAFASPDWLNHVMEEEYLHLVQKRLGSAEEFARGTALELEFDVHDKRQFPAPPS